MPAHIISIGECMVELARTTDDAFRLAYGGDTFNTAVYLARLADVPVAYATALGADPYSDAIVAIAEENRVGTELIVRAENRMPGLYLIETEAGERTFWYWRETAPARDYLRLADRARLAEAFASAQFIYLSGITLSLYDASAREELGALIDGARKAGTRVVMDSNFRPRGWPGDRDATRKVFADFWQRADIALPTFDDEQALWDEQDPKETLSRIVDGGASTVVVKLGDNGALGWSGNNASLSVPCPETLEPVDTTAAGDSFNAGFLAAHIAGQDLEESISFAHDVAAAVIQHRGAIVPKAATAPLAERLRATA